MTSATWSEPLTGSATGGGSIVRWFGLLTRWLRGVVSVSEGPKLERMKAWAHVLGAPVLAATSRDDLTDRLDAAFEQPEFRQLMREAAQTVTADALASVAITAEALGEMEPVLGKAPTTIIANTAPLMAVYGGVLAQLLASGEVRVEELPADWYDLFSSPGVHSTTKRSLLGALRASIALMAISHAVFHEQRLEPWLALALAESYRDEFYQCVRFYASLPIDIEVPESVVPLHDRFDLAHLQAEVEANEFLWTSVAGLAGEGLSLCEVPDDD
jgi:hypothetical protein